MPRLQKSLRTLLGLFLLLPSLSITARASSYDIFTVALGSQAPLIGLEPSGAVVVKNSETFELPYETYVHGALISRSEEAPSSLFDDGVSCSPSVPSGFDLVSARCNDGFELIRGYDLIGFPNSIRTRLYTGSDLQNDFLAVGGDGGPIFLNQYGDAVWEDAYTDLIYEALPQTPEPSSVVLLGTGLAATLAMWRKRRSV